MKKKGKRRIFFVFWMVHVTKHIPFLFALYFKKQQFTGVFLIKN